MKVELSIYLILIALFAACNSTEIEKCKSVSMKYKDLPAEIKEVLFFEEYKELNNPKKYELISKKDRLLPWVYNASLRRIEDNKTYKLNFSTEHRSKYIIKDDFLYVPQHYNIYESDSLKYSFSKFRLK